MEFFNSTAKLKELHLLEYIEANPKSTQKEIAKEINAAVSMVNLYMTRLEEKNYLIKEYQSAKVVEYHITAEGKKQQKYLLLTYFRELIRLSNYTEKSIQSYFDHLAEKGYQKIIFYGAGEVGETILTVSQKRKKAPEVLAIVDDSEKKKDLLGYKIIGRDEIKDYDADGIVITSYSFEEEIKERLKEINYPEEQIELFFSEM